MHQYTSLFGISLGAGTALLGKGAVSRSAAETLSLPASGRPAEGNPAAKQGQELSGFSP